MEDVNPDLTQCKPHAFEYIRREQSICKFIQFDGFATNIGTGYVVRADEDGDRIMYGGAYELRKASDEVRLSIPVGTKKADVVRLVQKILKELENLPYEHIIEYGEGLKSVLADSVAGSLPYISAAIGNDAPLVRLLRDALASGDASHLRIATGAINAWVAEFASDSKTRSLAMEVEKLNAGRSA